MYVPPGSPGYGGGRKPGTASGPGQRAARPGQQKPGAPRATRYSATVGDDYRSSRDYNAKGGSYGGVARTNKFSSSYRQQAQAAGSSKAKDSIARLKASALKAWDQPEEVQE